MTAQNDKIFALITPVFREVFEDPDLLVTDALKAQDVPTWDSLNHITLIVELEQVTGVSFTSDELIEMVNVGDLVRCLTRKGVGG